MNKSKEKTLKRFLINLDEEKKYLGKNHNFYLQQRLIDETKRLTNATWMMALFVMLTLFYYLFSQPTQEPVILFLRNSIYIIGTLFIISTAITILAVIIKKIIPYFRNKKLEKEISKNKK